MLIRYIYGLCSERKDKDIEHCETKTTCSKKSGQRCELAPQQWNNTALCRSDSTHFHNIFIPCRCNSLEIFTLFRRGKKSNLKLVDILVAAGSGGKGKGVEGVCSFRSIKYSLTAKLREP